MKPPVIPINHVLRIKRDNGRVELELMRFLTLPDAKCRRPGWRVSAAPNDAATGSAMLRDAIIGMARRLVA